MKIFNDKSDVTVNISSESIIRMVVLVIVTVVAWRFLGLIHHQIELIGAAAFLALALNPAVSYISRHLHIKSRVGATGLAYLVVLVLLSGFLLLVVPPLVSQTNDFVRTVPSTVNDIRNKNSTTGRLVQRYHLQPQINKVSHQVSNKLNDAPSVLVSTASRVGGVVISMLTILVLTFMMLVEGPLWFQRLWAITPANKTKAYKKVAHQMYRVVTGYVNGQVLIATIAAGFSMVALLIASTVIGTSINAVALGGIVFLFGLIPLIGNTLAAILVVLICLFTSLPLAIVMAIYFPIYQQIENTTLQPHIQAKNNQLTPLLVFMSALVGAGFGGLLGAFVAIPAAGCFRIVLEYRFGDKFSPTFQDFNE
ncbi:MAG: AI-2E family transporter [Candidatus Saccharimonadales bacterium]